jgi:transposase
LHRKNALFYKTTRGAHVGDIFMSLIHTCELCEADAFGYLTALERNTAAVAASPQDWMPWSYRQTLTADASPAAP